MSAAETIPRALGCVRIVRGNRVQVLDPHQPPACLSHRSSCSAPGQPSLNGPPLVKCAMPRLSGLGCSFTSQFQAGSSEPIFVVVQPVEAVEFLPGAMVHVPQRQAPVGRVVAVEEHHARPVLAG